MEKTAMQEALEYLYKNADYLSGPNDCGSDRAAGQYLRLMAEEIEEKYLPKERQQIEDAGNKCGIVRDVDPDGNVKMIYESGEQYYTTTYGE